MWCPQILSLFKFTFSNCTEGNNSTLSIVNTYTQPKTITLSGKILVKNGKFYYSNESAYYRGSAPGYTTLNFAPLQSLSLLLDNGSSSYSNSYYSIRLYPSIEGLQLRQNLSLKCQSPSQKKGGLLIVPSCNNQSPRFVIENTSNLTQVIGYYGTLNNRKFKILVTIDSKRQHNLDLSILSKGKKPTSMTYKVMVYTKSE